MNVVFLLSNRNKENSRTLGQPLLGERVEEEEERERIMPLKGGTTFCMQHLRVACKLHLDKHIRNISRQTEFYPKLMET